MLDYLTSANYGDGLPNATPTWTYDAAGNRNDAVTDNLNRATSIGGVVCSNDILGNRLTKGTTTYGWDILNRMTSLNNGSITTSYTYRADGMRVRKSNPSATSTYRYDGQMAMQEVEVSGANTTVMDYALGPRGVEAVSRTVNGGAAELGYPLYDAHGNRAGTLVKSGGGWQLVDPRTYDAWGNVRSGATTGRPAARYCANLGHVQDDESGLIYMRARYYEPGSGRFLSEDPAQAWINWFQYGNNCPTLLKDPSGKEALEDIFLIALTASALSYASYLLTCTAMGVLSRRNAITGLIGMLIRFGVDFLFRDKDRAFLSPDKLEEKLLIAAKKGSFTGLASGVGTALAIVYGSYAGMLVGIMWEMDFVDNA